MDTRSNQGRFSQTKIVDPGRKSLICRKGADFAESIVSSNARMSVISAPPLVNSSSTIPWWVCPPDHDLALRARIKTGYSTLGQRINPKIRTFTGKHISPTMYRRFSGIQMTERKQAMDEYSNCNCGGRHMVFENSLSKREVEVIRKVVARAEVLQRAEQVRVGFLILELKELRNKCTGNGTSHCVLCNQKLSSEKPTCSFCEKAVCKQCRVDTNVSSNRSVISCKVCFKEQELWQKSGNWFITNSTKVTFSDNEQMLLKDQVELPKKSHFNEECSLVETPVDERKWTPSNISATNGSCYSSDLSMNLGDEFLGTTEKSQTRKSSTSSYGMTQSSLDMDGANPDITLCNSLLSNDVGEASVLSSGSNSKSKSQPSQPVTSSCLNSKSWSKTEDTFVDHKINGHDKSKPAKEISDQAPRTPELGGGEKIKPWRGRVATWGMPTQTKDGEDKSLLTKRAKARMAAKRIQTKTTGDTPAPCQTDITAESSSGRTWSLLSMGQAVSGKKNRRRKLYSEIEDIDQGWVEVDYTELNQN